MTDPSLPPLTEKAIIPDLWPSHWESLLARDSYRSPFSGSMLQGNYGFKRENESAPPKWQLEAEIQGQFLRIVGTDKEPPRWLEQTLRGIEKTTRLRDGWDSYGAKRVQRSAVQLGLSFMGEILNADSIAPEVFPTIAGGIQFEWHARGCNLEIEVAPDGKIVVYCEDLTSGDEWEAEINGDLSRLRKAVDLLR